MTGTHGPESRRPVGNVEGQQKNSFIWIEVKGWLAYGS